MPHDQMVSLLKTHNLCLNCFKSGHFIRQCPSLHRCRKCQGLHHTLLHTVTSGHQSDNDASAPPKLPPSTVSHVATGLKDNTLLMTCRVKVKAPNGLSTEARGLLDSASSTSFVSERLAQRLGLPRTQQAAQIAGVAGISHQSVCQSVTFFSVSSFHAHTKEIPVSAIIVPRVTCELPLYPVSLNSRWTHLSGLRTIGIP